MTLSIESKRFITAPEKFIVYRRGVIMGRWTALTRQTTDENEKVIIACRWNRDRNGRDPRRFSDARWVGRSRVITTPYLYREHRAVVYAKKKASDEWPFVMS